MRNLTNLILVGGMAATLALTGCEMMNHHGEEKSGRSAGRMVDDKTITDNVNKKLENDPVYKFQNLKADTFNGVVQLSGFAQNEAEKKRAGQIAQDVEGVTKVENSISLVPQGALQPTGRESEKEENKSQPENQPENQQH